MQAPEWGSLLCIVDGSMKPIPLSDLDHVNPAAPCPAPPLVPGWGWGTVTWSTQKFLFRLIVLLYG